jgi:hypothetical protein
MMLGMTNTPGFMPWLRTQVKADNAIGDLARDVVRDPDWPSRGSLETQRAYLEERDANPRAIDTLERAWSVFVAARGSDA